jgi:SAM-dependent methyltransferase
MKDGAIQRRLAGLLSLGPTNSFQQACACKVCGCPALPFDVVDFWKFCSEQDCYAMGMSGIPVTYFRCIRCEFIFTTFFDDWSPEDFSNYIYNDDYARIDGEYKEIRPARDATAMAARLVGISSDMRMLDYGSGSGAFAATLRELNRLNFSNYDPFSHPSKPEGEFDLLTCFEVMEHSAHPLALLTDMKRFAKPGASIVFSTGLQPPNIETIRGNWWYIGPRNGHASIFNAISLALLAERLGFGFCGNDSIGAFRGLPASDISQNVTGGLGVPLFVRYLTAPEGSLDDGGRTWHSVEQSELGLFRWSKVNRLTWNIADLPPVYPCRLRIEVPFLIEAASGYTKQCRMFVNGREILPKVGRRSIAVDMDLPNREDITVILAGPELRTNLSLGADTRQLGLAIPT